jgi:hypothetical protein
MFIYGSNLTCKVRNMGQPLACRALQIGVILTNHSTLQIQLRVKTFSQYKRILSMHNEMVSHAQVTLTDLICDNSSHNITNNPHHIITKLVSWKSRRDTVPWRVKWIDKARSSYMSSLFYLNTARTTQQKWAMRKYRVNRDQPRLAPKWVMSHSLYPHTSGKAIVASYTRSINIYK